MPKKGRLDWVQYIMGVLAIPIAIGGLPMIDTHPSMAYSMFAIAIVLGIISICILVFRKRRKISKRTVNYQRQKPLPLPAINYEKLDSVTAQDKKFIETMGIRMMGTHGHEDLLGMMSDRANGVPINDLMSKVCSKCGIPRNRRGRKE